MPLPRLVFAAQRSIAMKDKQLTPAPPQLRVVVSTPLSEDLCAMIEEREPRLELVRDQSLLPPMRWPGDHGGDPASCRSPSQQQAFEALVDSADALYGIPDESPEALRRTVSVNPRLRWVHTMAAGGGGQIKAAGLSATELDRLVLTTSAGVHANSLAEFALLGVLAGAKDVPRLLAQQRDHDWSDRWVMGQISEQIVLVVGLGSIGRRTAELLHSLGARVWGTSRSEDSVEHVERIVRLEDLSEAIGQVDAVVITLPGTESTEQLIDVAKFDAMRSGTTFVSVGRGTVIDEPALIAALIDGRVGFAALDVFAQEPLDAASPLWDMPNVLLSPHTAALTTAEDRLIAELFARNAASLIDGRPLINALNKQEFY